MWDNPRLLNAAAGALTALALMVFAVAAMQLLLRSALFPLREMTVRGNLAHTSRAEIEQAAQGRVGGNFFAVDLAQVRASLEALPWVRRVEVRRVWPERLEATLEEHVALARWAAGGLVNPQGERFGRASASPGRARRHCRSFRGRRAARPRSRAATAASWRFWRRWPPRPST